MTEQIKPKTIKIARTKNGSPCLWESYVEFDDMKRATVVVDQNGFIKNSIFIKNKGSKLSLIPIEEGDFVVKVFSDENGISTSILKIIEISNMSNHAKLSLVQRITPDSNEQVEEKFKNAVEVAKKKFEDPTYVASELIVK